MKTTATLVWLICCAPLFSQTYQINLQNAYAEVLQAAPGDTIHLWAEAFGAARTFSHWSGDTSFLEHPGEWHTRLIMPAQDVQLQSNTKIMPTGSNNPFTETQIMGRDRMKRVFSYFPANTSPAGVCWLWHGTGGSANSWVGGEFEQFQFARYLVANGWGVIITESDESTAQMDMNGDGALRYDYYPDSVQSVDIANVRAIRDTFIQRGKMSWSTPQAAVGFSAGGAFSVLLASILNWQAAITTCNPGGQIAIPLTVTPILFSVNQRDNHPDVGMEGNLQAYENYEYLRDKGQCSDFWLQKPSPLYPYRFNRLPGISTALSASINNELAANGCLGQGGYLIKSPAEIEADVMANPANWPVGISLTNGQRGFVLDQINVLWSSHHFHSDYMHAYFQFISNPCNTLSGTHAADEPLLHIYPNPAVHSLQLPEGVQTVQIIDIEGRVRLQQSMNGQTQLDIGELPAGLYFLQTESGWGKFVKQ